MLRSMPALLLCTLVTFSVVPAAQSPATGAVVRVTSPAEDAVISGVVTIAAAAGGDTAGVTFEVDGLVIGAEDVSAPWNIAWNTAASGAGSHILTAIARDAAGHAVRSDVVPVVVGGVMPPPFPPPTNHNPTAVADALTSPARSAVTFTGASLIANDSDPDGHHVTLTLVAASSVAGGTIANNGGDVYTYTPAVTFDGTDTFTYSIADGFGGVATTTVSVVVTAPMPTGLVLALGFEETSGTAVLDASGSALTGTIRQALRVPGKFGRALSFDGVNDWLTITDTTASPLDLTTAMTVEAWVSPASMSGWETAVLKERGAGLLSYALYAHDGAPQPGGAAVPAGYVRAGGVDRPSRGASPLPLNTWTHIATTYDGMTQRFYVNGVLVESRAQTGGIAVGNGALRIGGNNAFTGEFFHGLIDEVRIYNRALSAAQIAGDMARPIR
jgi:hypothetical protein